MPPSQARHRAGLRRTRGEAMRPVKVKVVIEHATFRAYWLTAQRAARIVRPTEHP